MKWKKQDLKGDMDDMLGVAEQLTRRFVDGEFANWLISAFDKQRFPCADSSVIKALHNFKCPVVTTNYDNLIERETGRESVDWTRGRPSPATLPKRSG